LLERITPTRTEQLIRRFDLIITRIINTIGIVPKLTHVLPQSLFVPVPLQSENVIESCVVHTFFYYLADSLKS